MTRRRSEPPAPLPPPSPPHGGSPATPGSGAPPDRGSDAPAPPPAAPALGAAEGAMVAFETGDASSGYLPFAPLRSEPPPKLFATWWLRYLLVLSQLVGIVAVLLTEYSSGPGGLIEAPVVVAPHLLAAVLLVAWSALAMIDARRLVPATRYQQPSRATVSTLLWLLAFAAPVGAHLVVEWARDRFAADSDDVVAMVAAVFGVMVSFLLVWLPFSYHTRQAQRIGAPSRVVAGWFWLPLVSVVGVLLVNVLGLDELLADGGVTDAERTIQVAVVYGAPSVMFVLTTWRATTVFDEVIDLRWRRWRTEWHQTLAAMSAQPAPGPEAPH